MIEEELRALAREAERVAQSDLNGPARSALARRPTESPDRVHGHRTAAEPAVRRP